ncbi:AMP-binding protein [Archaeoglobus neptunius]|uniref:AMP-binding protein n=1 Tax=Archaeoglobus neptunius TaxID=2798580 RepID=UPI001926636D|nr:AMP-binding protein [Archaeoglobus neptunius]
MNETEYFSILEERWSRVWPHPSLPRKPIYPLGKIPIHEYLEKYAEMQPQKDYIIYYGRRISYKEMDELSNRLANYLLQNGFGKGDKVALILPNMPQFYIGFFGTLKAGGVCVFLNPMLKEMELEYFLKQSKPKFVLTLDLLYPLVDRAAKKVSNRSHVVAASFQDFLPETPEIPPHPSMKTESQIDDAPCLQDLLSDSSPKKVSITTTIEDYATMNFTGGTTGLPKGVYHRHLDIIYTGAGMYTYYNAHLLVELYPDRNVDFEKFAKEVAESDVALAAMPIFWVAGNNMGIVSPTISGSTVVLLTRWDVRAAVEAIDRYRVTTFYAPFDLYWEIINYPDVGKYDLTSLRSCTGSSFVKSLTKDLRQKWRELTGAILREAAYGLTETYTSDTFTAGFHKNDMDIERSERYGGSFCGIPIPETYIKIVDENGNPVPLGEKGEVVIKSPSVVSEYVERPEETAKSFKNGWLFTGDIGMYDEDGFFYYISRKKYMLKVSGISVYPTQIEFIMLSHPAVEMVGVIGAPDPEKGQVPIAFVKLKPGYQLTEQDLLKWCRENMAPYNVPKRIIIREQLPLTATGKVIREELVREYEQISGSE